MNRLLLIFIFTTLSLAVKAQDNIFCKTQKESIEFSKGEYISNKLIVVNNDPVETKNISVRVSHPGSWKFLGNKFTSYSLPPLDTIYIPIRIIPLGFIKGGTKYLINCYVVDNDINTTIAASSFFVRRIIISDWELNLLPQRTVYLKNNQDSLRLGIHINNKGNDKENLILSLRKNYFDNVILTDTTNKKILKSYYYRLNPLTDTIFYFNAGFQNNIRNHKKVNIDSPLFLNKLKEYKIFATVKSDAYTSKKVIQNNTFKIKKLPNQIKINPFSSSFLPITLDANVINIASPTPVLNLVGRGRFYINDTTLISYSGQLFSSLINPSFLRSSVLNFRYSVPKYSLNIGQIGTGNGFGGRGIGINYNVNRKLSIGLSSSAGPSLLGGDLNFISTGLTARYLIKRQSVFSGGYSHVFGLNNNIGYDFFRTSISFPFAKKQYFSVSTQFNRSLFQNNNSTFGLNIQTSYSGSFFNNKYTPRVSYSQNIGNRNAIGSVALNFRNLSIGNGFKINKNWTFRLNTIYSTRDSLNPLFGAITTLNNNLNINGKIFGKPFTPSIYYNTVSFSSSGSSFTLLGLMYSLNDNIYNNQILLGANFNIGLKTQKTPENLSRPFSISNIIAKYRVWTINLRHSVGSMGVTEFLFSDELFFRNQVIALSVSNQYQFKNPSLVLENNFTLRRSTAIDQTMFQLTPQLYYFTKNEYRLLISPSIFWQTSNDPENNLGIKTRPRISSIINLGIRKTLAIPIKKSQLSFKSVKFCAFIDNNGNRKKDKNEELMENVVVRVGNEEVITNSNGEASLLNMFCDSTYDVSIFSINDVKEFFPYYKDLYYCFKDSTVLVPFVKGVKVYGEIYIDRDENQRDFNTSFDLSNLRVSAFDGQDIFTLTDSKGKYEMYVPYGEYTISLDENIMGNKFRLLENNFDIKLDQDTESVFVTFYLVEKRKKITIKKF